MQDEILRRFNGDVNTKEVILSFIVECINEEALHRMYKGESVAHITDAKKLIDLSFEKLSTIYGIKEKPKQQISQSK